MDLWHRICFTYLPLARNLYKTKHQGITGTFMSPPWHLIHVTRDTCDRLLLTYIRHGKRKTIDTHDKLTQLTLVTSNTQDMWQAYGVSKHVFVLCEKAVESTSQNAATFDPGIIDQHYYVLKYCHSARMMGVLCHVCRYCHICQLLHV